MSNPPGDDLPNVPDAPPWITDEVGRARWREASMQQARRAFRAGDVHRSRIELHTFPDLYRRAAEKAMQWRMPPLKGAKS